VNNDIQACVTIHELSYKIDCSVNNDIQASVETSFHAVGVEATGAQKSVGLEFSPSFQTSLLSPAFRFDALEVIERKLSSLAL